jgi:hypothetical protein
MSSRGGPFRAQRVRYVGQERFALIDASGERVGLLIAGRPGESATAFGYEYGPVHDRSAISNAAELPELPFFAIERLAAAAWAEIDRPPAPAPPKLEASVCPSCGEKNKAGAPFCGMCKAVLNRSRASSAPAPIRTSAPTPAPVAPPVVLDQPALAARLAVPDFYSESFGIRYDYSLASVVALDAFLDEMWGEAGEAPGQLDFEPGSARTQVMVQYAAYLGEVFRRRSGASWSQAPEHPNDPRAAFLALGGTLHWPFGRVLERLREGASHDLFSWVRAIVPPTAEDARAFDAHADEMTARSRLPAETRDAVVRRLRAHGRPSTLPSSAARPGGYREAPSSPSGPVLVFFDPPHASPLDYAAAAQVLGIHVSDARMRVGTPAPLPVLLLEPRAAEHAASALRGAGLSAEVVPVAELLATPAPEDLTSIGLDPARVIFETTRSSGDFAWRELRAAFLVIETVFVRDTDHAGRAATARASAELDRAEDHWTAHRDRGAARRSLGRIDDALGLAETVKRDERSQLSLHLVVAQARGRLHFVCPMSTASPLLDGIARYAPDVKLDRRAERAPLRLPPITGIGAAFGGKVPSATDLHVAFIAWKTTR